MKKKLFLIRHCEFDQTEDMNVFPGPGLNSLGIVQSERLCVFLMSNHIERIVSSDFTRALESIQKFAELNSLGVNTSADLRERNPAAEQHESLKNRVQDWFELNKATLFLQNTVIVSHCGPVNMILEQICENMLQIEYSYEDQYLCHTPKAGIWQFEIEAGTIINYSLILYPY